MIDLDNFKEDEVHKKYQQLNIPNKFTLKQIDDFLKKNFLANEIKKDYFPELEMDPYYDYSQITKCYAIENQKILTDLFNDDEKNDHLDYVKKYGRANFVLDHSNMDSRIHALSQGSLLYVFFQTDDTQYISSFYSNQGPCEKIFSTLSVFKGINLEDCELGNINYKIYLLELVKSGFITL